MSKRTPTRPALAEPAVYTVHQVAALLDVSRETVDRLAREGKIPGRLSLTRQTVRYAKKEIDAWLSIEPSSSPTNRSVSR